MAKTTTAQDILTAWEYPGLVYVVRGDKVRQYGPGDCCRVAGSPDIWRIVLVERNKRTGEVLFSLRGEFDFTNRLKQVKAKRLRYLKPPYSISQPPFDPQGAV